MTEDLRHSVAVRILPAEQCWINHEWRVPWLLPRTARKPTMSPPPMMRYLMVVNRPCHVQPLAPAQRSSPITIVAHVHKATIRTSKAALNLLWIDINNHNEVKLSFGR